MKAKVIRKFRCLRHNRIYRNGDIYEDDAARLEHLQGRGFVEVIAEPLPPEPIPEPIPEPAEQTPRHVGGGWYELPDGTRIKGKEGALKALDGD